MISTLEPLQSATEKPRPEIVLKWCEHCGSTFYVTYLQQKYCDKSALQLLRDTMKRKYDLFV